MATFDVRNSNTEEITEIVFADEANDLVYSQANKIILSEFEGGNYLQIYDNLADNSVCINTREHAENLIKALRKAIELGWVE